MGAGTVGVGAAETMKGSDTLYDVTRDVVATCLDKVGGVNVPLDINYIGTGSGAGEDAMTKVASATQRLAPMSRFVQGAACAPLDANASSRKAEGVNFALDGLSIVSSKDTGASAACNGTVDCNRTTDPGAGFVHNKTVTLTMKKIVPGPNGAIEETSLAGDDVYEGAPDVVGAEGVLPAPTAFSKPPSPLLASAAPTTTASSTRRSATRSATGKTFCASSSRANSPTAGRRTARPPAPPRPRIATTTFAT